MSISDVSDSESFGKDWKLFLLTLINFPTLTQLNCCRNALTEGESESDDQTSEVQKLS